jgi:ankyrin repeat protein
MYHSHEASLQHDKIYALLGLSSDAMNDTSLSPNYDLDWKKLFETLVGFVLYKGIQVGPSPNKEHTLIRGAAYILGSVRSAEFDHRANGEQDVQVEWRNVKDTTKYAWMSCNFWTLRPSTKPVLTGDVICLFREASQPIIIRICKDDCFVIRIAPTPPSGISFATNRRDLGATPMEWSKFEEMAQLLPARSIQCIWDWGTLPERLQKEREFEKSKVDSRVVSGILNSVLILGEAGAHDEAVREFQELMWAYETSCENDPLRDTVAFEIGQKKDFIMCYMKEHFGKAPLSWAAEEGYKAVVDLLIRYDEGSLNFVDRMGHAPLTSAVKGGHLDVIERLLLEKLDINISAFARMDYVGTALQGAAYWGRIDIVERLLQEGADVNSEAAPYCGRTALQAASECDHFEIVERLLKAKADVNAAAAEEGGLTALQAAARMGHSTIVELLLQEGADVDAEAAPSGGMTALQAAAWAGHTVIVERLLKEKAKVNGTAARDWGTTALRAAVKRGHVTIVDRLLQEGAYLNAMDKDGMTALLLAAQRSSVEIVERLLQEGADVNAKDNYGRTALGIATEEGHQAIVERLREAGAE